jgi:hypothetical protein
VTERSEIESMAHETSPLETMACSICGIVLKSPQEGIVGDNNIAYCVSCYKHLLFPNLDENYIEIID